MNKIFSYLIRLIIVLALVVGASAPALGETFYAGKTIRFIVGFSPGGGFDTYTRVIARHIGKHIPGNPSTLVQNMTGAGSLIAANYTYSKAKPDGLAVGNWIGGLMMQQIYGSKGVKFDARKFEWVGTAVQGTGACAVRVTSGITSLDKWFAAKKPVKIGGEAPGSSTYDLPRMLQATLGLPIQIIQGYRGTAKIRLAAESGEVAGACWTWESMKSTWRKGLESGEVKVLIQSGRKRHADLPDVPNAIELAKTEEARLLIRVGLLDVSTINRGYSLPPGTPRDRVQILQRAFTATMRDPEFLAETKKAKLDLSPLPGDKLKKTIASIFELDAAIVGKLRELLVPKG
jgi:tripartite-type tricarboxylate transporter receptor subunit TctC